MNDKLFQEVDVSPNTSGLMRNRNRVRMPTFDNRSGWIFIVVEYWKADSLIGKVCRIPSRHKASQPVSMEKVIYEMVLKNLRKVSEAARIFLKCAVEPGRLNNSEFAVLNAPAKNNFRGRLR